MHAYLTNMTVLKNFRRDPESIIHCDIAKFPCKCLDYVKMGSRICICVNTSRLVSVKNCSIEPRREKTGLGVSEYVQHKPDR